MTPTVGMRRRATRTVQRFTPSRCSTPSAAEALLGRCTMIHRIEGPRGTSGTRWSSGKHTGRRSRGTHVSRVWRLGFTTGPERDWGLSRSVTLSLGGALSLRHDVVRTSTPVIRKKHRISLSPNLLSKNRIAGCLRNSSLEA